jgi:hypothetical protein
MFNVPLETLDAFNAVKLAPDPLKPVAVNKPVDGLNWYFVLDVYSVDKEPLVALAYKG